MQLKVFLALSLLSTLSGQQLCLAADPQLGQLFLTSPQPINLSRRSDIEIAKRYWIKYPQIFVQIFPYCDYGRETALSHKSLADCFKKGLPLARATVTEAIVVGQLADSGLNLPSIKSLAHKKMAHWYPELQPSLTYQHYLRSIPYVEVEPPSLDGDFVLPKTNA